jgi:hypothetical protein
MDKPILDACCGSRMFWFDKQNPNVVFQDIRDEDLKKSNGDILHIRPDKIQDFTRMDFADNTFSLVVFRSSAPNRFNEGELDG